MIEIALACTGWQISMAQLTSVRQFVSTAVQEQLAGESDADCTTLQPKEKGVSARNAAMLTQGMDNLMQMHRESLRHFTFTLVVFAVDY